MDHKVKRIRDFFGPVIGAHLIRYETAEIELDDGTWDPCDDLPIRLFTDAEMVLSIAWSEIDDLWLSLGLDIPFDAGSNIRWVSNSRHVINGAIGKRLTSAMLGRGEMSIEGKDIEIWTRLILRFGDIWLEIFNALDENGYDSHLVRPIGAIIECI